MILVAWLNGGCVGPCCCARLVVVGAKRDLLFRTSVRFGNLEIVLTVFVRFAVCYKETGRPVDTSRNVCAVSVALHRCGEIALSYWGRHPESISNSS